MLAPKLASLVAGASRWEYTMDKSVVPFDWHRMLLGEPPAGFLLEIVLRVVLIYAFALLFMQIMGKRGRNQMNPLEFLIIIALGSATGDVMFYPDVPIVYAALVIALIVVIGVLLAKIQAVSERFSRLLESEPTVLVQAGRLIEKNLKRERVSNGELFSQLRESGIEQLGQVRIAILELSGRVSVFQYAEEEVLKGPNIMPKGVEVEPKNCAIPK